MDALRWKELQEVFTTLAELPPKEQAHALQDLYKNDPEIAQEAQELLEEDSLSQGLLETGLEHFLHKADQQDGQRLPVQGRIGPYSIVKFLGEGGMGVVYLAERTDIAGHAAVKLLRDSWISPIRRQRFAVEQQMLGLLNHPSIARIYDAGATTDGTPWFALEFVDGVNITEYLQREKKPARETMQLFCQICEAVRYAHSLAIIHRDLKPSNILVTKDSRIKLLDFGIAKQMDLAHRESNATIAGFRLFTPAYAAPELQSDDKVGVFTDVFSLGVILFELLTGSLPYPDGKSVDREPPKPSGMVLTSKSNSGLVLNKSEWADVDAICMKALDPQAERRYRSVDALISDIEAFLEDRPLDARKHAFFYTARKFAWRNRGLLGSAALALLIFVAVSVFFTIRLARARDAAVAAAAHSARVQQFTASLLTGETPGYGISHPTITVAQLLDRGRSEALHLTGDPRLQTDMFQIVGTMYSNLGQYSDAEPLLRRAQQGSCSMGRTIQCSDIELILGNVISRRSSYQDGEVLMQDALQIKQAKLPANDLSIADAMVTLGEWEYEAGKLTEAKNLYAKAFAITSQAGHPTPQLARAMGEYANSTLARNDPRAITYEQQSAQMTLDFFGKDSFEYAESEVRLGVTYRDLFGKYDEAEQYFRRSLAAIQAWAGPNEGVTVPYMVRLAMLLSLESKFDEARAILLSALSILDREDPAPSTVVGSVYFWLGFIELQRGQLNEAENHFNEVVSMAQQHQAVAETDLETSELGLATIYAARGAFTLSEKAARHVVVTTKRGNLYVGAAAHAILGHALLQEGKVSEAEPELELAYQWFSHDPKIRPFTVEAYQDLSETDLRLGKPQEAKRIREELRAHPR